MNYEPQACGRSGVNLTLYLISGRGARPVAIGFQMLHCGHFPVSVDPHSVGVLLCETCAERMDIPSFRGETLNAPPGARSRLE
jgi:hypothetical protein